jgi:MFS family permease
VSSAGRTPALAMLRHRPFVRYLVGRAAATLGWQLFGVAVAWQVYGLTHDPLALGFVGLCEFLPFAALVMVGGHVADHADRRRVLALAYTAEVGCVAVLGWLTFAGLRSVWPIYAAIGVFGVTRAFWSPALQAILPKMLSREEFADAVALNSLVYQGCVIGGPALGGVLLLLGVPFVYGVCLAFFVLTVVVAIGLKFASDAPVPSAGPAAGAFLEGVRFVLRSPVLLGLMSLDLFAVLFGGAEAMLPVFARDILQCGPVGYGMLRAAPGAGAALAGSALALWPIRNHAGSWMFGGVALFGVSIIIFGLSGNLPLSLAVLLLGGIGDMISVFIRATLIPLYTPDAIRGRVSAVSSMFIGASNELGGFESGLTARWFGVVPSVVIGGAITLGVVGLWAAVFPPLRRLKHLR